MITLHKSPPTPPASTAVTDDDPWLTSSQMAAMLDISPSTVRLWRSKHYGPPCRAIGRLFKYRRSDVEAWVANQPTFGEPTI